MKPLLYTCPKCKNTRWKAISKKDGKYQCRNCKYIQQGTSFRISPEEKEEIEK